MLGAILGALETKHPHEYPDARPIEDENEDNHWSSDDNLFEDWLLHGTDNGASEREPDVFY